ncbi:MAG: hypothetical protein ICV52_10055, partial [Microcoleus sp. C1-bin4]|nr:hypothetical protein [Microcoleus sp. C1-bin4]
MLTESSLGKNPRIDPWGCFLQFKIQNPKSKIIRPGLIHRLDKKTSGLMVIAKNSRAHKILS